MSRFDLVIFDCDGVLVDSERLAVALESRLISALGWPLSEAEVIERFVGRSEAYIHQQVELKLRRSIDWASEVEARYLEVFARELRPVEGVLDVLDRLDELGVAYGVASNSRRESLAHKLELTGLLERFSGSMFGSDEVASAKPAPDLYLHAARTMGVSASRCAVVEDSVAGVSAGLAAAMTVFAFTGGVTSAPRLARTGVVAFDRMSHLATLLSDD